VVAFFFFVIKRRTLWSVAVSEALSFELMKSGTPVRLTVPPSFMVPGGTGAEGESAGAGGSGGDCVGTGASVGGGAGARPEMLALGACRVPMVEDCRVPAFCMVMQQSERERETEVHIMIQKRDRERQFCEIGV
jgi:hypothetical protein